MEVRSPSLAITVEVVDDHFLFAESLGRVIRELAEYELVGIAVTGPQAIAIAQDKQPNVILLDFHLPGYTADQLVPRLRVVAPNSRIIILTSDTSAASLAKGVQAGVVGYLMKDSAVDDVMQALKRAALGANLLTDEQLAAASQVAGAETLTGREVEILQLLAAGKDMNAISEELVISASTVRTHLQNIFAKLGAHSRLEAVVLGRTKGLIR